MPISVPLRVASPGMMDDAGRAAEGQSPAGAPAACRRTASWEEPFAGGETISAYLAKGNQGCERRSEVIADEGRAARVRGSILTR